PFNENEALVTTSALLPARYQISRPGSSFEFVDPQSDPHAFFAHLLLTPDLDFLEPYLWVAGLRNGVRPLHQQKARERSIVPVVDARLHLVWRPRMIYLAPLHEALLHYHSFKKYFCAPELLRDKDHRMQQTMEQTTDGQRQLNGMAALGLLFSYTKLIVYQIDLDIAKEAGLVPKDVTYAAWTRFARRVACAAEARLGQLPRRWRFGELRLNRVNMIARLVVLFSGGMERSSSSLSAVRGYQVEHSDYLGLVETNFKWLLAVFAWLSVTLGALQVGVSVAEGDNDQRAAYMSATWEFSLIVLLAMAATIILVLAIL
ncbi:hypothetical protein M406DRAFT_221441, partial [Cryphonectria parasitica EP155]